LKNNQSPRSGRQTNHHDRRLVIASAAARFAGSTIIFVFILRLAPRNCSSLQRLCNFENLFGSCPPEYILRHHSPTNCAGRIDKELCWPRNVCALFSLTRMNQIIAANCLEFWIRKKSKSVSGFLQHVLAIDLRTINTDRNRTDSRLRKRLQIVFDTPQLGVT
jgi:hypothetical protein